MDLRVHPRAKRLTLRIDKFRGCLALTVPPGVSEAEALGFAERHRAWAQSRLADLPARVPFADGVEVPLLDVPHRIRHCPDLRGGVRCEAGEIRVSGADEHLPRRVMDFLKAEARREIAPRARTLAGIVSGDGRGRPLRRIALRDTRSRWGSCTSQGDLNFCWRLIFAPEPVLHYVVAHEAAHLRHLDHSPRFWGLLGELVEDISGPTEWLRRNGARLHRIG